MAVTVTVTVAVAVAVVAVVVVIVVVVMVVSVVVLVVITARLVLKQLAAKLRRKCCPTARVKSGWRHRQVFSTATCRCCC